MKFVDYPVRGFTTKYSQKVRVLTNEIKVSEVQDLQPGTLDPLTKPFKATWDTGATGTVITQNVINALSLKPIGKTTVYGVGEGGRPHEYEANTYLINLYLPNNVVVIGVRVVEGSIIDGDVLIGMDIIQMGDFAITNCNDQTCMTFRFPPVETIDFVEEIKEHNKKYGHVFLSDDAKRKLKNKRKAERKKMR